MEVLMKRFGLAVILLAVGCSTHVGVVSTRREDMNSQCKVLAVAARNLEDSIRRNPQTPEQETAAQAVAQFHTETERFASIVGAWRDEMQVDNQFEAMIKAWVRMQYHFPALKADHLTQAAYDHTAQEWEKMHRSSGYHGKKYEKEYAEKYRQEMEPKKEVGQ
jgi:ribosomal protein S15P/S13E